MHHNQEDLSQICKPGSTFKNQLMSSITSYYEKFYDHIIRDIQIIRDIEKSFDRM